MRRTYSARVPNRPGSGSTRNAYGSSYSTVSVDQNAGLHPNYRPNSGAQNRKTSTPTGGSVVEMPGKAEKIFANLTNSQVNLLRQSWNILFANRERHGKNIMKRTEAKRPETSNLFCKAAVIGWLSSTTNQITLEEQNASQSNGQPEGRKGSSPTAASNSLVTPRAQGGSTYNDHTRLLINLFDFVVNNVKDANRVIGYLKEVGARHAPMRESGLQAAYWESFGEAAMEIVGSADGVQQSKETVKTWRLVIAGVTHQVRLGFESELRRQREQANSRRNSLNAQGGQQDNAATGSRSPSRQSAIGD